MKKFIFALASCVLGLTSCTLDINDDPNAISSAGNDNLFPTAEMNLAATVGVGFNMYGGYNAEIYGQNAGCTNYLKYSQFEVTATNTSSSYSQLYLRVLQQLKVVAEQSKNEPGTYLAAMTLRAYTYQMLVDAYGETPYSEALTDKTQPKYDEGADVYAGIIKELEDAKEAVAANTSSTVCANILFGKTTASVGTAADWIPFANSVLLKLYMRESKAVDNKAKVAALIAENKFIASDVVYSDCFGNAQGSYSPLFQEHKTIAADLVLNYGITATFKAEGVNDNRLSALWVAGNKGMIGNVSGSNLSAEVPSANTADLAQPNYTFDMPVYLMTVAEVEFFKAEFYATLSVDHAKAEEAYKKAVAASFATAGVEDVSAAVTSSAYPYDKTNPMKNIGIQKWLHFATTLQGFEGWCELRRIGYPTFSGQKAEDIISTDIANFSEVPTTYIPGTIYTPKSVYGPVGAGKLRQRFDYASSSTQYNNNVPATKNPTSPIFWNK